MWQVAWAHPMYGNILASCSYDRKVIIWKEENGTWDKMYEYTGHDSSGNFTLLILISNTVTQGHAVDNHTFCSPAVNSVCWGPYDFGLILACGSSDGAISVLTCSGDGHWDIKKINNAHTVSFAFIRDH